MHENEGSVCERCVVAIKEIVKSDEELLFYDRIEFVKSFSYLETGRIPMVEAKRQ